MPTANDGLGVAFGAEYRREEQELQTDQAYPDQRSARPGRSRRSTRSARSTSRSCSLKRACRSCRTRPARRTCRLRPAIAIPTTTSASTPTPTSSACDWAPIEDVRLRGSYQRAVRAPNVQELFLQDRVQLDGNSDPCAGASVRRRRHRRSEPAECALTGVTAAQYGNILANPACAVQRPGRRQPGSRSGRVGHVFVRLRVHAEVPAALQLVGRLLRHQGRRADQQRRGGLDSQQLPQHG